MLVLKTQQNRAAHISRTLSISSGKSPREMRISFGTAKARWGFNKRTCAGVTETRQAGGSEGGTAEALAAASVPSVRVYLR